MNGAALRHALLLAATLSGAAVEAAHGSDWLLRTEAGRYTVHGDAVGTVTALRIGRSAPLRTVVSAGATQGVGEDDFTSLELEAETRLRVAPVVAVAVGLGAGVMVELDGASLSGPYFLQVAVELLVSPQGRIRLGVRRGEHFSFGDDGTWDGPNLLTVGWVFPL